MGVVLRLHVVLPLLRRAASVIVLPSLKLTVNFEILRGKASGLLFFTKGVKSGVVSETMS